MPSAGSLLVSSEILIYDDPRGCTNFLVGCASNSSVGALVNVHGLHDPGEYFPVAPGREYSFRLHDYGLRKVSVKGNSGTASIYFGVLGRTLKS